MLTDVLPRWERWTYWITGLSSIVYAIYALYMEGNRERHKLIDARWGQGWSWLDKYQDHSDEEWWMWRNRLLIILCLNTVHVVLSQVCFCLQCGEKVHMYMLLLFDLSAAGYLLGARPVIYLVIQAAVMFAVSMLGSVSVVWICSIALISSLNFNSTTDWQFWVIQLSEHEDLYQYFVVAAFIYIRLISFAIDKVKYRQLQPSEQTSQVTLSSSLDKTQGEVPRSGNVIEHSGGEFAHSVNHDFSMDTHKKVGFLDHDPSFPELLLYAFYLPSLMDGPTFVFHEFINQMKSSFTSPVYVIQLWAITKKLLRLMFWVIFIDFQFHFIYYSAMSFHEDIVQGMSIWAIYGMVYCQGQFFMVKYLCMYGIAVQMAQFDGIAPLPLPRCISWVYSYTDMWKHFDVGLYRFIKTYIYVPCGGSRAGITRRFIASAMAFSFIYFWHGATYSLWIWCLGNYIMVTLESIILQLEKSSFGAKLKSHMSSSMYLRLKAFLITPAYVTSCFQIFYFFYGKDAAWTVIKRLIGAPWYGIATQYVLVMANIHNAIYLNKWYSQGKKSM